MQPKVSSQLHFYCFNFWGRKHALNYFGNICYTMVLTLHCYTIFESPGENRECAGMHNGGNVDRSIGRDLPHSTAWRVGRVHIVSNFAKHAEHYSGCLNIC